MHVFTCVLMCVELCLCTCKFLVQRQGHSFCCTGILFAMASEYVTFKKHEVCHKSSKGCKVAQQQLKSLTTICELLLEKPGEIQDACAHLQSFLEADSQFEQEQWPSMDEIKTFSSIPRSWLWESCGRANNGFDACFIKKAQAKHKHVVREIMEYATDLTANIKVPQEFHDQEILTKVLDTRCFYTHT